MVGQNGNFILSDDENWMAIEHWHVDLSLCSLLVK